MYNLCFIFLFTPKVLTAQFYTILAGRIEHTLRRLIKVHEKDNRVFY